MSTKKLGFGLMRLPKIGEEIDVEQTARMAARFLEEGFTYFDTAYVYEGSEEATGKALVQRQERSSYTLATKLNVGVAKSAENAKHQLNVSLERTGAGYFDYYLLHCIMENNVDKFEQWGIWDFVKEQKAAGTIRHYGFSFHGGPALLERVLTEHPDVEFVQLQINYADWENPNVRSRECYEIARRHGKQIVVMEPVKGGTLADPPAEVKAVFDAVNPNASYASWAIRFVASLDGILAVLSGMSNEAQMEDNLSYMKDFQPLTVAEQYAIRQAQAVFHQVKTIPCTGCSYCTKGCPRQIPIPAIFAARNKQLAFGQLAEGQQAYERVTDGVGKASQCVRCGQCERACPQKIDIIERLEDCAKQFEG